MKSIDATSNPKANPDISPASPSFNTNPPMYATGSDINRYEKMARNIGFFVSGIPNTFC